MNQLEIIRNIALLWAGFLLGGGYSSLWWMVYGLTTPSILTPILIVSTIFLILCSLLSFLKLITVI